MEPQEQQSDFFRACRLDEASAQADARQRAGEAQALMDYAGAPNCTPEERAALLRDTLALLNHAVAPNEDLNAAYKRLRLLLGKHLE